MSRFFFLILKCLVLVSIPNCVADISLLITLKQNCSQRFCELQKNNMVEMEFSRKPFQVWDLRICSCGQWPLEHLNSLGRKKKILELLRKTESNYEIISKVKNGFCRITAHLVFLAQRTTSQFKWNNSDCFMGNKVLIT